MTDIIQNTMSNTPDNNNRNELIDQFAAWKKVQEQNNQRKIRELVEAETKRKEAERIKYCVDNFDIIRKERDELVSKLDKLESKYIEINKELELWNQVIKISTTKCKQTENMLKRRQKAKIIDGEIGFTPSMVAHRIWELTGKCDWAAIIRKEGLDGFDIMDLSIDDIVSINDIENKDEFMEDIIRLRDNMTKPIAELISIFQEKDDPIANWYEAQSLIKAMFVKGLKCNDTV